MRNDEMGYSIEGSTWRGDEMSVICLLTRVLLKTGNALTGASHRIAINRQKKQRNKEPGSEEGKKNKWNI